MKSATILFSVIALAAALNVSAADDRKERRAVRERADRKESAGEVKGDMEQRIRDINRLDNKPAVRDAGLRSVSKELGIPVPTLEAQLKSNPGVGIAGLLIANSVAQESKKDVDTIIKAHGGDRSWADVARNNNVTLSSLETRLQHVETAMKDGK